MSLSIQWQGMVKGTHKNQIQSTFSLLAQQNCRHLRAIFVRLKIFYLTFLCSLPVECFITLSEEIILYSLGKYS